MSFLLVFATLSSFLSSFLPIIIKPVLACVCVETKDERDLRNLISSLRVELTTISAVDSFAQYARTERKLNKSTEELKRIANVRRTSNMKLRLGLTLALRILMAIWMILLVWTNKAAPVIVLPKEWLYPISPIISWPTDQEGAISITAWVLVSESVMRMAAASVQR